MKASLCLYTLSFTVLGISFPQKVAAVDCIGSSYEGPRDVTQLRLMNTNNWSPVLIKKRWVLPGESTKIAMYSTANKNDFNLVLQPVLPSNGFRIFKVKLAAIQGGYDGGEYILQIPDNSDNCVANLQEKGMDVLSVAVY